MSVDQAASSITEPAASTEPTTEEILAFDPFMPKETPSTDTEVEGTPADVSKGGGAPGTEKPKPDAAAASTDPKIAAPPTPATTAAPSKTAEQLLAENTAAIRQMLETRPAAAAKDEPPAPEAPKFNLGIPPQILDAMVSEDPKERATATHALVNGIANAVWREADTLVKETIGGLMQNFPRLVEAHIQARESQQSIYNDFYGKYEMFKNPAFVPLVQTVGMQVFEEARAAGKELKWGPEVRDAIAERLFLQFPTLRPSAGNGAAAPKPRLPFASGGGARPATAPAADDEMLAVLKAH